MSSADRYGEWLGHIKEACDMVLDWTASTPKIDRLYLSAIERQLLIVSEAAIRIDRRYPGRLETEAPDIDWAGVRGFGNFLWHQHEVVSPDVIRTIIEEDVR